MTKCDHCGHQSVDSNDFTDLFGNTVCRDTSACYDRAGHGTKWANRPRYRLTYTLERVEEERHEYSG